MIRSVSGKLVSVEADACVVEVGGVGLLVRCSATTARALPLVGSPVSLTTHLVVREDALDLYGFSTPHEREMFELFLSVSGVGPRMSLAICGVDDPAALQLAVARGDSAKLQRAVGVGKRIAERVVLDLKDKVGAISSPSDPSAAPDTDAYLSARDGLVGLGFRPEDADRALSDAPAGATAEDLIRFGLSRLAK